MSSHPTLATAEGVDEIAEAHRVSEDGQMRGKLVLVVGSPTFGSKRTVDPDTLRINGGAVNLSKASVAAGKPIAAICNGPWTVIEADVARGGRPARVLPGHHRAGRRSPGAQLGQCRPAARCSERLGSPCWPCRNCRAPHFLIMDFVRQLHPGLDAEFGENGAQVRTDGVDGDAKFCSG